jgi:hypothetical protein
MFWKIGVETENKILKVFHIFMNTFFNTETQSARSFTENLEKSGRHKTLSVALRALRVSVLKKVFKEASKE